MGAARAMCRDLLSSAEAAFGRVANVRASASSARATPRRIRSPDGVVTNEVDLIIRLGAICPESRPEVAGKTPQLVRPRPSRRRG